MKIFRNQFVVVFLILLSLYHFKNIIFTETQVTETADQIASFNANTGKSATSPINTHSKDKNYESGIGKDSIKENLKSQIHEDLIPWEELNNNWMEVLQNYLLSIDYQSDKSMFQRLRKEKNIFQNVEKLLNEKRARITDAEFNRELSRAHNRLVKRTKEILGEHYIEVKHLYMAHEASLQIYARNPNILLGLDPAFAE